MGEQEEACLAPLDDQFDDSVGTAGWVAEGWV
jgi:hypothetical protein